MAQPLRMFPALTGGLFSSQHYFRQLTTACSSILRGSSLLLASEGTHSQMHMLIPRPLHEHIILLKKKKKPLK